MTRATLTILAALALTAGIAHAGKPEPANIEPATAYNCDDGDYHLLVVGEKGAPTVKYVICEFHECSLQQEMQTTAVNSNTGEKVIYDISSKTEKMTLILNYKNGDLDEANVTDDQYTIQSYNQCRRLN